MIKNVERRIASERGHARKALIMSAKFIFTRLISDLSANVVFARRCLD